MATSLTLRNDPTLQQGYVDINGTTSATFTTSGITANLTGNVTGNVTGNADTAIKFSTTTGSAPAYACRAWVNFDGTRDTTGAVSAANTNRLIRASGNVTSVLRNGIGDYTITFTTPMSDANYSLSGMTQSFGGGIVSVAGNTTSTTLKTTAAVRIQTNGSDSSPYDIIEINIQVFGN